MDRTPRFLLLAAVGLACALAGEYAVMGDDAVYLSLARGLARGWGYASMIHPLPRPEGQYPPLLPTLLYPFQRAAPESAFAPRLFVAVLTFLGLAAAYAYRRAVAEGADRPVPEILLLLPCLAPACLLSGGRILAEGPTILFAYVALWAAERDRNAVSAASCLAAMLLRQYAWGLFAGLLLFALLRRNGRLLAWLVGLVLLGCAPWWIWQWRIGSDYLAAHILVAAPTEGSSGALDLVASAERIFRNATRYAGRCAAEAVFPFLAGPEGPLDPGTISGLGRLAASLALVGAALYGFGARFARGADLARPLARVARPLDEIRRTIRAEDGYVVGTGAMLLLHPVYDARYLVPLLPTLLYYALERFPSVRWPSWMLALVFAGTLAAAPFHRLGPGTRSFLEACEIARELPPGAPVVSRKPGAVWWYAGRPGAGTPGSADPLAILTTLKGTNTPYLLVDRLDGTPRDWERWLEPSIAAAGPQFAVVGRAPSDSNVRILRWTAGP